MGSANTPAPGQSPELDSLVTPEAKEFLGLAVLPGAKLAHIRFRLEDGRELHIPISRPVLDSTYQQLQGILFARLPEIESGGVRYPTLTVERAFAAQDATGAATIVQTKERGPIAFLVSLETIPLWRTALAETEALLRQPAGRA